MELARRRTNALIWGWTLFVIGAIYPQILCGVLAGFFKSRYFAFPRPRLAPRGDEIAVTKTTGSALTGANLWLILINLGVRTVICVGVLTDRCVSSTIRGLADLKGS